MSDADYEAATLAIREWTLWVAIAQVTISAIQTGIVYYGIRAMIRATDRRSREAADAAERAETARREAADAARREADQRHAEAMQAGAERHAENMAAIKALIDGQAQTNATLAANTATLAEATAALKLVVERTAPAAGR